MNENNKNSLAQWIANLKKYVADYADALTWGGPTIHPKNPLDQSSAQSLIKLLESINTEYVDALGEDHKSIKITPVVIHPRNKKTMTTKLAFVYLCQDEIGEVEGVFDADDNTMLGTWCSNDGTWRSEYFNGFLENLGYKIVNETDIMKTILRDHWRNLLCDEEDD